MPKLKLSLKITSALIIIQILRIVFEFMYYFSFHKSIFEIIVVNPDLIQMS